MLEEGLREEKGTEGDVQRGCEVVGGEGQREGGGDGWMDGRMSVLYCGAAMLCCCAACCAVVRWSYLSFASYLHVCTKNT